VTFTDPKPGGWNPGDKLTSDQLDAIRADLLHLLALDPLQTAARELSDLRDAALRFHVLDMQGDTVDDGSDFMAAAQLLGKPYELITLVKAGTNDVFAVAPDEPRSFPAGGDVPSITASVQEAANNGTRLVVIGTGGNLNAYSDNQGGSWTAGAAGVGGAVQYLVWSPANALAGGGSKFFSGGSGTGSVYKTPTPSTVWTSIGSAFPDVKGLAVLGGATANNGYVVALGASGGKPRFSVLTDGGNGADFTGTQQPPNAALADEAGSIAGAASVSGIGDYVYHVMRTDSGARLRLARTSDGTTWSAGPTPTIEKPSGVTFTGQPRLLIDQNMGLMVIAVPVDAAGGTIALYVSRDFETWVGPAIVNAGGVSALAVAGGRVMYTQAAFFMISAGLGAGVGV
jgi:hypothetical protein